MQLGCVLHKSVQGQAACAGAGECCKGEAPAAAFKRGVCCIVCRRACSCGQWWTTAVPSGVPGCVLLGELGAVLGSCSTEGCALQVASTLTRTSLVPQNQPVKVLSVNQVSKSLL